MNFHCFASSTESDFFKHIASTILRVGCDFSDRENLTCWDFGCLHGGEYSCGWLFACPFLDCRVDSKERTKMIDENGDLFLMYIFYTSLHVSPVPHLISIRDHWLDLVLKWPT